MLVRAIHGRTVICNDHARFCSRFRGVAHGCLGERAADRSADPDACGDQSVPLVLKPGLGCRLMSPEAMTFWRPWGQWAPHAQIGLSPGVTLSDWHTSPLRIPYQSMWAFGWRRSVAMGGTLTLPSHQPYGSFQ